MGKIFKDIEDLVEEGGKYDIPEVDNSGTQKDLSRENIPPEPGPTPQQGKDNPKPPDVEPQEFEERDRPPKTSEFDHRENVGERPGETSPFQHKQREDLRPDQTQPFQHQERDDRDISSPNRAGMEDRGNRPPKTEPFDHVSEARNRPDDAEKFDHVSESDRANIKKASKFPHQENAGERPDKTSPYGHEENEDLTPDKKTPYQHEQNQDLQPSETGPFEHEGKGLKPDETAPFDHEENKDLKPDKTSPFGHEQNEDLRPSETGPYEHEENEDLSPDETSPFQHEEDGDLTPSKTSPFEHEQDEDLQPSETSSYQHEQDEDLQPPEDQPYQHEENKDLKPSSTQPFEHEQDENLQPSQTQAFEHEQDEDLQPSEDQPYQHEENEDLRPPSTQPFEHEQDEELQPPEDQTYQHEEDEELTPPEATRFEHEQDEELQPSETTPFEHEQNEELQPSEDQIYQHEEDEDLTPSDTQPFQHEEDEELRPSDTEPFQHEEDEELRPSDTEPFGHEQDEDLQPSEDKVFQHEQDEELQPSDPIESPLGKIVEINEGNQYPKYWFDGGGEEVMPNDVDNTPLDPVYESGEGIDGVSYWDGPLPGGERKAGMEPIESPLGKIVEINENTNYPNFWEEGVPNAVKPNDVDNTPLDPVFNALAAKIGGGIYWEGNLESGGIKKVGIPDGSEAKTELSDISLVLEELDVGVEGVWWDNEGKVITLPDETIQATRPEIQDLEERLISFIGSLGGDEDYQGATWDRVDGVEGIEIPDETIQATRPEISDLRERLLSFIQSLGDDEDYQGVFWDLIDGISSIELPDETIQGTKPEISGLRNVLQTLSENVGDEGIYWTRSDGAQAIKIPGRLLPATEPEIPDITEDLRGQVGGPLLDEDTGGGFYWDGENGVVEISSGPDIVVPETNEEIRERQISNLWEVGGFSLYPFEGGAPYGPFPKPGSSRARRRGSDTRAVPLQHTLDDQERLANFQTSPKGLVFTGKQFALQFFNPRPRTRIYNPVSLNQSAIPYIRTTRHLSADDGSLGSLISSVSGIVKSSKFSDEIEEATENRGYLINSIPNPEDIEDLTGGAEFAKAASESIGARIEDVVYRHESKRGLNESLSKAKDAALSVLGIGGGDSSRTFTYFQGTFPNSGYYGRDGHLISRTSRFEFLDYNFSSPYVLNARDISHPPGESDTIGVFNFNYLDGVDNAFDKIRKNREERNKEKSGDVPPGRSAANNSGDQNVELSSELQDRIEGNWRFKGSEMVARTFYGRSDGISSIAEYESLPKQKDDISAIPENGNLEGKKTQGMRPEFDSDEDSESAFYQKDLSNRSPLSVKDHGPEIILHQDNASEEKLSYGLPNYSQKTSTSDKIDELGVISLDSESDSQDVDASYFLDSSDVLVSNLRDTYKTEDGKEFEDLVPFKIKDKQNHNLLVFRSFINDVSINSNVQWESQRYLGRPEQFHIYTGADREISISFELHPFSHDGLKAQWQKLNYLQGLIYPSDYVFLTNETEESERDQTQTANTTTTNTGAYMIPPFLELTIGDIYRDQNGYINSLTISPESDTTWSMVRGEKLPEHVSVDIQYTIIEETAAQTGTKFFDTKAIPNPAA